MKSNYCPYVYKGLRINFKEKNNQLISISKPCCHVITDSHSYEAEEFNKDLVLKTNSMKYFQDYFENNDDLPYECISCIKLEQAGQNSHRTRAIANEVSEFDIHRLDIVIGNICNLACPFCSSHASSLINVLSKKHEGEHLPEMWKPHDDLNAPSHEKVKNAIHEILTNYKCQSIKVIGGEPFLKDQWIYFEELLENNMLLNTTFEITTNGTIMNKRILDSLAKTKKTLIRISIDSIDKNYDFIRWPYTFDKIIKNIQFLSDNKPNNLIIQLSCLVNVINFEYLPDIENLLKPYQNTPTGDFKISYETLIKPSGQSMDWRYLSQDIINEVCSKLENQNLINLIKNELLFTNTENTTKTLKFLLKQRNMFAEDVFKPATRKNFNL